VPRDAVERVEVMLDPRAFQLPFVREVGALPAGPTSVFAGAMSVPHALSCLASGVPPGPRWYTARTLSDEERIRFARRVTVAAEPATDIETVAVRSDPDTGRFAGNLGRTRLLVGGEWLDDSTVDCDGDPWNEATRWTWARAASKATTFSGDDTQGATVRVRAAQELAETDDVASSPLL
jgi:hypothetical protein